VVRVNLPDGSHIPPHQDQSRRDPSGTGQRRGQHHLDRCRSNGRQVHQKTAALMEFRPLHLDKTLCCLTMFATGGQAPAPVPLPGSLVVNSGSKKYYPDGPARCQARVLHGQHHVAPGTCASLRQRGRLIEHLIAGHNPRVPPVGMASRELMHRFISTW